MMTSKLQSPSILTKEERRSKQAKIFSDIQELVKAFIELNNDENGNRDHFSTLFFIGEVEKADPSPDKTISLERAVFMKGTPQGIENTLINVFREYPALFALIQKSVVSHLYESSDGENALQILKKQYGSDEPATDG